jgi:hypothetical protein
MLFGLSLPALVGLLVEVLKKVGIVANGDQARIANIILSGLGSIAVALLAEFNFEAPQLVIVIVGAVYSVVASALGYTAVSAAVSK